MTKKSHFTCDHEPDFSSLHPADEVGKDGIVDVRCKKCGCFGSARIEPDDIDWGEEANDGNDE